MNQGVSKLAKLLASDELKKRRLGYKYTCELLKLNPGSDDVNLSYIDILGICKGLYYSLWMQDKLLLQEEAVARIVKLINVIRNRDVRSMYVRGMFATLAREWDALDIWRQNKFMMLVRDFFVRCIICVKKKILGSEIFATAIYDSILNSDYASEVDLKLHLICVLKEELLKAGEVPVLVNAFFKHTLDSIQKMPRGSVYTTDMITLLNFLAKQMRKYPKFPLGKISDDLLLLSTKVPLYRKTFLRMSKLLHVKNPKSNGNGAKEPTKSLATNETSNLKKGKKSDANASKTPELKSSSKTKTNVNVNGKLSNDSQNCGSVEVVQNESKLENPRKRKLNKDEAPISTDEIVPKTKRLKKDDANGNNNLPRNAKTGGKQSVDMDITISGEKENNVIVPNSPDPPKDTNVITFMTPSKMQQFDMSVLDTVDDVLKPKRVSFGKVYSKKFSSTKKLSDKPVSIATPPNRGILRK